MIPETIEGRGYNVSFRWKRLLIQGQKYLYEVTSVYTPDLKYYNVFKTKSDNYPEGLETIFNYDEAIQKFKQL